MLEIPKEDIIAGDNFISNLTIPVADNLGIRALHVIGIGGRI